MGAAVLEATRTKVCTRCAVEKSLEQFHRQPVGLFGRASRCRACKAEYAHEHRAAHIEHIRAHDRQRAQTWARRIEQRGASARKQARDPAKGLARRAVREALRTGALQRAPCEVCGSSEVDAHHDDYAKPLAVRWLCRVHHCEHHALEVAAKRATEQAASFQEAG